MRRLWAPSTIRYGSSAEASPKGRHKKFRRLSRARLGGAPASHTKSSRRRFKPSWFRGGRQRRSLDEAVEVRAPRRRRLAGANGLPGRSGKLRGPYHVRALRARWRVARANGARLQYAAKGSRYTAKRSNVAAGKATATGLELVDLTLRKVQQLKEELGGPISRVGVSKPPAVIETVVEIISSPSQPIRQGRLPEIEQARDTPPPTKSARDGGRGLIASTNLEAAITEAVRKEGLGCEAFVGVIVQQTKPKSRFDANWAVRGVKFGRADRDKAHDALAIIVERMQREFRLSDD
jgi:hypothetical protein